MENFRHILFDKNRYEIGLLPQRSIFAAGRQTLLSGTWRGVYREEFSPEILDFLNPETSLDPLPQLTVPLPLELQLVGRPQYVNVQYPFDGSNDGEVGGEIRLPNPCMLYLKDLPMQEISSQKRYILNFKGSESAFFLYVNGKFACYSENLFLDSEFDISPFLVPGVNRIGVLSFRYCASSWLLDQDFYRFSGLTRDVVLSETDALGLFDADIRSRVDSAARTSRTTFTLTGSEALRELTVTAPDGSLVWQCRTDRGTVTVDFRDLALWSAETPNLYTLTVTTFRDSLAVERVQIPFGFREVCIRDGIALLNGKRLVFNGINRHEWNMTRGRSVTREDMEFDVRFLKTHNINAVRTSHYPNHSDFYGLCSQAGLYMIDEACLESHGSLYRIGDYPAVTPLPGDDESWNTICINKLLRMYERDKNHPAILLWSLGNESGVGRVFARMRQALLDRNPDVLIHYEQCWCCEDQWFLSDVHSTMYTGAPAIADFIENGHDRKPYILCEYAHAMGNSLGDLDSYRDLIAKYPNFQGGFVWDYMDQALLQDGKLCYGGDFLDKPNDRDFCCNGVLLADRSLSDRSSKAHALAYSYQPLAFAIEDRSITVRSHYLFRDTGHLEFLWEALAGGEVVCSETFALKVAPGGSAAKTIALPETGEELLVRVRAIQRCDDGFVPGGTLVAWDEQLISPALPVPAPVLPAPKVVDGYFNIGVTAGEASYLFSKSGCSFSAAGLNSIRIRGEEFLTCEPRPTVFRPTTSNDFGCGFHFTSSLALAFSKNLRGDGNAPQFSLDEGRFTITYRYLLDPGTREGATVTYTVDGSGKLTVRARLDPLTNLPSLPLFGIHFQLPGDKENYRYFGRGPWDNYPDRKKASLSGIYESRCGLDFVPYIYPQESGNHEDTRWLEISGQQAGVRFESTGRNFAFKYLPNSDFEIENATHVQELPQSGRNHLTVCGFTRGVGGDDSWYADVHEPFTLPGDRGYEFEFSILPLVR